MDLILNQDEQALLETLLVTPPDYTAARNRLQEKKITVESVTKVGIRYAEACFGDYGDLSEHPQDTVLHSNSTDLYDVIKLLLEFGLDPNAIYETHSGQHNIMDQMQYIDNGYCAPDTLALLLEHGGNPNLVIDGESIFESIDFDIWFGSVEQEIRWRYDIWVHMWMVLVAYGGEIPGKGSAVHVFQEYNSNVRFDLQKLRNHRDYYFGLSMENNERRLHIYDKKTLWKVAER